MAITRYRRFGSEPHTWCRNAFTVSTVGEEAVKNRGLALGSGSTGAAGAAGAGGSGPGAATGVCDEEAAGAAGTAAGFWAKERVVPRLAVMAKAATTECNDKTMLLKMTGLADLFFCVVSFYRGWRSHAPCHHRTPVRGAPPLHLALHPRCSLLPLVFAALHQRKNPADQRKIDGLASRCSLGEDLFRGAIPLHIRLENRVQPLVRQQRVGVALAGTKLRRGRLLN